jgi:ABC-type transport system involved in multi-copper enzyme maturation permease subunit
MIREIAWKEWRENRGKYAALWLVFNLPMLGIALMLALSRAARTPFADLNNQTFMKYLPVPLWIAPATITIFLFMTGYVGVAMFLPEVEDRSMFFLFEQPLARWQYAAAKLATGGAHVALAVVAASLLAPAAAYAMILATGKVTVAASAAAFGVVMAAALRAGLWCALLSVAVFAGCALIGSVVPRWWLATICGLLFILGFAIVAMGDNRFFNGDGFFDLFANGTTEGTTNVSMAIGNWQWLTVSGPLPLPTGFARWHLLPTVSPIALICLFTAGVAWVFQRKELK